MKSTGRNQPAGGDVVYGRRPVLELLKAGRRDVRSLHVAEGARRDAGLEDVLRLASAAGAAVVTAGRDDLAVLTGGGHHQGVAAACGPYPYVTEQDVAAAAARDGDEALVLFLDHLEDPQNVGAILRTALAAGVTGVVIPKDRAVEVTPAVVRASAGAAEHARVARVTNLVRTMEAMKKAGMWMTGLDAAGESRAYGTIDYRGATGIVVGSEGRGLGRLVRERCDFLARIPMRGPVDSLNAGVAAAVALFEVWRQREAAGAV